jgi:tRNA(Leu) C34 or U34 (ribose-2'-O)-methylase TrmL
MSRGFAAVGLIAPKKDENVGGVFRAAGCYGASFIGVEGSRTAKYKSDTPKTWKHLPVINTENILSITPYDTKKVAIEIVPDAISLPDFKHPERALYIFGPEDGSLRKELIEACDYVVKIPTKYCMNLAATVNVVLYDRTAKEAK